MYLPFEDSEIIAIIHEIMDLRSIPRLPPRFLLKLPRRLLSRLLPRFISRFIPIPIPRFSPRIIPRNIPRLIPRFIVRKVQRPSLFVILRSYRLVLSRDLCLYPQDYGPTRYSFLSCLLEQAGGGLFPFEVPVCQESDIRAPLPKSEIRNLPVRFNQYDCIVIFAFRYLEPDMYPLKYCFPIGLFPIRTIHSPPLPKSLSQVPTCKPVLGLFYRAHQELLTAHCSTRAVTSPPHLSHIDYYGNKTPIPLHSSWCPLPPAKKVQLDLNIPFTNYSYYGQDKFSRLSVQGDSPLTTPEYALAQYSYGT
jgi:hypothetical protein